MRIVPMILLIFLACSNPQAIELQEERIEVLTITQLGPYSATVEFKATGKPSVTIDVHDVIVDTVYVFEPVKLRCESGYLYGEIAFSRPVKQYGNVFLVAIWPHRRIEVPIG